jgi:inosine/xanthosine triphosphate pyrophosphatase family protein
LKIKNIFSRELVNGTITREKRGTNGFGYDPIFLPAGKILTFAEMELTEKNTVSHRARAFAKLKEFLLMHLMRKNLAISLLFLISALLNGQTTDRFMV